jgi:hypothetical protein
MRFLFRNVWIVVEQKNLAYEKNFFLEEYSLIYLKIFIIYNI